MKLSNIILLFQILILSHCVQSQTSEKEKGLLLASIEKCKMQDYNGAIKDCNNALKENPNSAEAYLLRGNVKAYIEDFNGAMADLNQSIKLNPNSAEAYKIRCIVRMEKDKKGALIDISKSLKLDPENATNYNVRGKLEREMKNEKGALKDFKMAIQMFTKQIAKDSKNSSLYIGRATATILSGEIENLCFDLKKAKELGISQADELIKEYCK